MEVSIELKNIRKKYNEILVIDDFSFRLKRGERVILVGPNACGKTTLLKIIAGIVKPDAGHVTVNGIVSMVFQEDLLIPWMKVKDNIGLLLRLKGVKDVEEEVNRVAKLLNIKDYLNFKINEISGGTVRKVNIARALTLKPDILLLDEPFIELDEESRRGIMDILDEVKEEMTMVITTHYPEEFYNLANKVYFLTPKPMRIKEVKE